MQSLLLIFILFIVVLLLIYIFFKSKQNRVKLLLKGTCPSCGETKQVFKDDKTQTFFTKEIICKRVLKTHGCSGVCDIEFSCSSCDLKEVYSITL